MAAALNPQSPWKRLHDGAGTGLYAHGPKGPFTLRLPAEGIKKEQKLPAATVRARATRPAARPPRCRSPAPSLYQVQELYALAQEADANAPAVGGGEADELVGAAPADAAGEDMDGFSQHSVGSDEDMDGFSSHGSDDESLYGEDGERLVVDMPLRDAMSLKFIRGGGQEPWLGGTDGLLLVCGAELPETELELAGLWQQQQDLNEKLMGLLRQTEEAVMEAEAFQPASPWVRYVDGCRAFYWRPRRCGAPVESSRPELTAVLKAYYARVLPPGATVTGDGDQVPDKIAQLVSLFFEQQDRLDDEMSKKYGVSLFDAQTMVTTSQEAPAEGVNDEQPCDPAHFERFWAMLQRRKRLLASGELVISSRSPWIRMSDGTHTFFQHNEFKPATQINEETGEEELARDSNNELAGQRPWDLGVAASRFSLGGLEMTLDPPKDEATGAVVVQDDQMLAAEEMDMLRASFTKYDEQPCNQYGTDEVLTRLEQEPEQELAEGEKSEFNEDSKWKRLTDGERIFYTLNGAKGPFTLRLPDEGVKGQKILPSAIVDDLYALAEQTDKENGVVSEEVELDLAQKGEERRKSAEVAAATTEWYGQQQDWYSQQEWYVQQQKDRKHLDHWIHDQPWWWPILMFVLGAAAVSFGLKLVATSYLDTVPVDCVGDWRPYRPCTVWCGNGTQTQTYTHSNPAQASGKACPVADQTNRSKWCRLRMCPIDCQGEHLNWSPCTKTCNNGTQTRFYKITREPQYTPEGEAVKDPRSKLYEGGLWCKFARGSNQTRACRLKYCPINCVGRWQAWGSCSKTCGAGTSTRTFEQSVPMQYNGIDCSHAAGKTEVKKCQLKECPINCKGDYTWTTCTASCTCETGTWPKWTGTCENRFGGDVSGTHTGTYAITVVEKFSGLQCRDAEGLLIKTGDTLKRTCDAKECPRVSQCPTGFTEYFNADLFAAAAEKAVAPSSATAAQGLCLVGTKTVPYVISGTRISVARGVKLYLDYVNMESNAITAATDGVSGAFLEIFGEIDGKHMAFKKGTSTGSGGAVVVNANAGTTPGVFYCSDCAFEDNVAKAHAGAVFNNKAKVKLTKPTFKNNKYTTFSFDGDKDKRYGGLGPDVRCVSAVECVGGTCQTSTADKKHTFCP